MFHIGNFISTFGSLIHSGGTEPSRLAEGFYVFRRVELIVHEFYDVFLSEHTYVGWHASDTNPGEGSRLKRFAATPADGCKDVKP